MSIDHIEHVTKGIDTIEHVEKANPYHDERGRFTTASGGGGAVSAGASSGSFSAGDAEKEINGISSALNNGGGDSKNDWKKVRDILQEAPLGTVMTQTGSRGIKFQSEKTDDDEWTDTVDGYKSTSKLKAMAWVGTGYKPSVSFATKDNAPSTKEVKDSHRDALNGKLDQVIRGAAAKKSIDTIEHVEK